MIEFDKMDHTMKTYHQKSLFFMIFVLFVYFIDSQLSGILTSYFSLNSMVIEKFEIWRILLFPFATGSISNIFIFIIAFYFYSPKLATLIQSKLYPIIIIMANTFFALVCTFIVLSNDIKIGGFEAASFYIISFYSLINGNDIFQIFNFKVKIYIVALISLIAWSLISFFTISTLGIKYFLPSGIAFVTGFCLALITFIQLKLSIRRRNRQLQKKINAYRIPSPEELTPALISESILKRVVHLKQHQHSSSLQITDDMEQNEDTLNFILEKINEKGASSLTPDEIKFLEDYSKLL